MSYGHIKFQCNWTRCLLGSGETQTGGYKVPQLPGGNMERNGLQSGEHLQCFFLSANTHLHTLDTIGNFLQPFYLFIYFLQTKKIIIIHFYFSHNLFSQSRINVVTSCFFIYLFPSVSPSVIVIDLGIVMPPGMVEAQATAEYCNASRRCAAEARHNIYTRSIFTMNCELLLHSGGSTGYSRVS